MTQMSSLTPKKGIFFTSYSGITLHRSCPQAWSYKNLYGLSKPPQDDPKVEARFGTWWHALRAAEAIERGRRLGSIKFEPDSIKCADDGPKLFTHLHVNEECADAETCKRKDNPDHFVQNENLQEQVFDLCERWEEAMPDDHAAEWKSRLNSMPSRLLRSLDARYVEFHAKDIVNERPLGVEVKWSRQLPGTEIDLIGYTDEVYFDVKRGMVVVRDHKTSKQLSAMTAADDMLNSQLHLNAWGLSARCKDWECGPVSAISYERVMSVMPTTPKLIKSGKLSKTVTNFDLSTYMAFCESDEAKAAGYEPEQAQIDRITAPGYMTKWFQRTLTPINRNIARAHLQAAIDTEQDSRKTVARVQKRGEAPRNMTGAACKWCDFAKLCRAQMVGGADGEYDVREYGLRHKASEKAAAESAKASVPLEVSYGLV